MFNYNLVDIIRVRSVQKLLRAA